MLTPHEQLVNTVLHKLHCTLWNFPWNKNSRWRWSTLRTGLDFSASLFAL